MNVREVSLALQGFCQRHGFSVTWSAPIGNIGLVRPGPERGLYDQVWITLSGQDRDALTCYAGVSVVMGRGTKGLVELEVVRELATVEGRGYALIRTPTDLKLWADALERAVPEKLKALAQRAGPALLSQTREARQEAEGWAAILPSPGRLEDLRRWAVNKLDDEGCRLATRLAGAPGVVGAEHERELYEVAALVLVVASASFPEAASLLDRNLISEPDAMWRVQLLADLLRRRGTPGAKKERPAEVTG